MDSFLKFIKPVIFGTIFNLLIYPIFLSGFIKVYFVLYKKYPLSGNFISINDFWGNFYLLLIFTFIISLIIGLLISLIITAINPQTIRLTIAIAALFALFISVIIRPPFIALINYILHQDGDYELEVIAQMLQIFVFIFCQTFLTGIFVVKLKSALENSV